jgi:tetraacyldisaccharide 4'-kinase
VRRAAPAFWWQPGLVPAAVALWPAARLWGAAAAWRLGRTARYRPPVGTICVGNYVVGGAGKTPTTIALVRVARQSGAKPGILARGYGGQLTGPLVVDPARHGPLDVGDEALLLAAAAPTVIAGDRAEGASRLVAEGADLILMDDGFQDPAVRKDLSLIAVDAAAGIGNGMTIPSGPLRAPLLAQLQRTDALIVIGEGAAAEPLVRAAARAGRSVLRARLKPARVRDWRRGEMLAFAGIGRPQKFFDSLAAVGARLAAARAFPDHHAFTAEEATEMLAAADAGGLRLVTTEKDAARLRGAHGTLAELRERAEVFEVALEFDNPVVIAEMVESLVRKTAAGVFRA